jgi:multidrug efflux pump subunit AcrA (membrane-fusion protein)
VVFRSDIDSIVPPSTIVFVAPSGSNVKQGELLVEFDSALARDRIHSTAIEWQLAKAGVQQAQFAYDTQHEENVTTVAKAELDLALAKLELESQTGALALRATTLETALAAAKEALDEARALFEKGFQPKSAVSKAENELVSLRGQYTQLTDFDRPLLIARLEGSVQTAERGLKSMQVLAASRRAEVQAELAEAKEREGRQRARSELFERQLAKYKVHAPIDGVVVLAAGIAEGAAVRERQILLWIEKRSDSPENVLRGVLCVPTSAVNRRGDGVWCSVETPDGVENRTIQLGRTDGRFVEVVAGLEEGERVLIGRLN